MRGQAAMQNNPRIRPESDATVCDKLVDKWGEISSAHGGFRDVPARGFSIARRSWQ
jgi:hypothetical protein